MRPEADGVPEPQQARDVVAFGQEVGRVLSDGRVVGRAESFAKVFPSSRMVKQAVGAVAWVILEDIALDARLDVEGRLVAETNVRRIAANLALARNTVARHLRRLREHGFVLHEEAMQRTAGRFETARYVLDPSAALERFTVTPSGYDQPGDGGPAAEGELEVLCPSSWDTGEQGSCRSSCDTGGDPCRNSCDTVGDGPCRNPCDTAPCPKSCDTAENGHMAGRWPVSQSVRHRELRHNREQGVVVQQQQPSRAPAREADRPAEAAAISPEPAEVAPVDAAVAPMGPAAPSHADQPAEPTPPTATDADGELAGRLTALGVDESTALRLATEHPADVVADALDAVAVAEASNPAGWAVAAIRGGWDIGELADEQRRLAARRRRPELEQARRDREAAEASRRQEHLAGWTAAAVGALDDGQLTAAVGALTAPMPGVGRRALPEVRARLASWAAAVRLADPAAPLPEALAAALAGPGGPDPALAVDGELPAPPDAPRPDPAAVERRLRAVLAHLDRPSHQPSTEEVAQ